MRQTLFILLSLFSTSIYSQKVTIKGTAFDTTKGFSWIHIVVNDTLRKFRESKTTNEDNYKKLKEDSTLSFFAKRDGTFQVTANKTDSIFFQSYRHKQKVYCVSDLLKMKSVEIRLDPDTCIPYTPCHDTLPSNFYVFIGQKLKVFYEQGPYYCNVESLDSRYIAEYKILEEVVGHYNKDTIRFTVFDHYGSPPFSQYENVLIFVSEYCGKLYHVKYQYFDLYKTSDGKWASPGDPYKYDKRFKKNLIAQNIKFADSVWFDVSKLNEGVIKQKYPEPFYKVEGQKAIPIMGSYIDDLMTVKKDGVFKARNIRLD